MYLLIHTMTIVQNDCIMEAQFFHTIHLNDISINSMQLIAKRIRVKIPRNLISNRSKLGLQRPVTSSLKTIAKRKNSHIKHHLRTIKIIQPSNRQHEYLQKIEECTEFTTNQNQQNLPRCSSNSNLLVPEQPLQDTNVQAVDVNSTVQQINQWLSCNRFNAYLQTFSGFSGADMLRMSKEDLIQICGQADGIRLFNSLHSKSIAPKLTLYVCRENSTVFHAVYMTTQTNSELSQKLSALIGVARDQIQNIYCQGPHGIHVLMSDDVIQHIKQEAMYSIDIVSDPNGYIIILKPIIK